MGVNSLTWSNWRFHFSKGPKTQLCYISAVHCPIGVVKFFKVPLIKCLSTDFGPKVTDLPSNCHLTSFWSCKPASKSEAPKSTLLYKSCSNQKNPCGFVIPVLKVSVTNPQGFFIQQILANKAENLIRGRCSAPDLVQMKNFWLISYFLAKI